MKNIFNYFLQKAKTKKGLNYPVEFPSNDCCLIKFPSHNVSLRIRDAEWDMFIAPYQFKLSRIYKISLVDNTYRLRVTSKYLDYDMFKPKCFGKINEIEDEIMRVQKLLNEMNPHIKLINEADEPWENIENPVDTSITLNKEVYRSGVAHCEQLVIKIKTLLENMAIESHQKTLALKQKNKHNHDEAYIAYNIKLSEKVDENQKEQPSKITTKTSTKKLKPVLGEDNRKAHTVVKNSSGKFVSPPIIRQNFYNIKIVPSGDYLLLAEMTNVDSNIHQTFYLGFVNTPFNMVSSLNEFGVELVFLNQYFKEDDSLLKNVHNQVITSVDHFQLVYQKLEAKFHFDPDA
jgi:hypothetical protein